MVDDSEADKDSPPPHEIVRKGRVRWWAVSVLVLLVLIVWGIWLKRNRPTLASDWHATLGFAGTALCALGILWKVPQWQVAYVEELEPKERFDRENEARKTLATIMGGIVLLVGGFATW